MKKPSDIVKEYQAAAERGDWETFESLIADDFTIEGPTPEPLGKRANISMHKALWAAFPDLQFNIRILEESGNWIKLAANITGTHTGTLIPPIPGKFIKVAPTGKKIALAEEILEYTIRDNQLVLQQAIATPDTGWAGIFKQLGIDAS